MPLFESLQDLEQMRIAIDRMITWTKEGWNLILSG
jgi:hypothetical protein